MNTCPSIFFQVPIQFYLVLEIKSTSPLSLTSADEPVTMACDRSYFICFQRYLNKAEWYQENKVRDTPLKQPVGYWLKHSNIWKCGVRGKFSSHNSTRSLTFLWEREDSSLGLETPEGILNKEHGLLLLTLDPYGLPGSCTLSTSEKCLIIPMHFTIT